MLTFYYVRHRRNLENLDLYRELHASNVKSGILNWEEQSVEDPIGENIFIEEPKLATDESFKDEVTKSPIDELPKPSPRYGHAACRYNG